MKMEEEIEKDKQHYLATAAAIASVRKIASCDKRLASTLVGQLNDEQLSRLVTAAIWSWIDVRTQQAIDGNRVFVQLTEVEPICDAAIVHTILPHLANQAGVDWSQSLNSWSKDAMTDFLLLAWRLISEAEIAYERGRDEILKRPPPL